MTIEFPAEGDGDCPFCRAVSQEDFIVASSPASVCYVPERAGTRGAVLVVSRRHLPTFLELSLDESLDLLTLGKRSALALVSSHELEAFNFWWDTGVLAGQQHLHVALEILPRHEGDRHVFVKLDERPVMLPEERRATAARIRGAIADAFQGDNHK